VWIIVIHLLWFTDYVPNAQDRYMLGYSIIFFLLFNVLWNITFLMIHSIGGIIKQIKACYRKGKVAYKKVVAKQDAKV